MKSKILQCRKQAVAKGHQFTGKRKFESGPIIFIPIRRAHCVTSAYQQMCFPKLQDTGSQCVVCFLFKLPEKWLHLPGIEHGFNCQWKIRKSGHLIDSLVKKALFSL